eukprot:14524389-Alexandrium_andersonii.AAC.1
MPQLCRPTHRGCAASPEAGGGGLWQGVGRKGDPRGPAAAPSTPPRIALRGTAGPRCQGGPATLWQRSLLAEGFRSAPLARGPARQDGAHARPG